MAHSEVTQSDIDKLLTLNETRSDGTISAIDDIIKFGSKVAFFDSADDAKFIALAATLAPDLAAEVIELRAKVLHLRSALVLAELALRLPQEYSFNCQRWPII